MKKIILFFLTTFFSVYAFSASLKEIKKSEATSFAEILKKLDPEILRSEDTLMIEEYLRPVADEVIQYALETYGDEFSEISEMTVQQVIFTAMSLIPFEERQRSGESGDQEPFQGSGGEVFSCLMTGIGAVTNISALVRDIQMMWNNGASVSSVSRVLLRIGRQYAGWFIAAFVVYEFGECMDWW